MGVWVTFTDRSKLYVENGGSYFIEDDDNQPEREEGKDYTDYVVILDEHGVELERFAEDTVWGIEVEGEDDQTSAPARG